MKLTPVAERLAVELSLLFFTTKICRDRVSNPDPQHASKHATNGATAAVT